MTRRFPLLYRLLIGTFVLIYALDACSSPNSRPGVSPTAVGTAAPPASIVVPPTPTQPAAPANPDAAVEYFKSFRSQHPDAAWPHWFADNQLAWSAVGLDGGGNE